VSSVTHPAYAIKTINDTSGGDCSTIGTWSDGTRTCTLGNDLSEGIVIGSNNVILDGNGHTITGSYTLTEPNVDVGVLVQIKTDVTIKNLIVKNFNIGINLDNTIRTILSRNTLADNGGSPISGRGAGIGASNYDTLTITGNTITGGSYGITTSSSSKPLTITGNTISGTGSCGISVALVNSAPNSISNNTISNDYSGICLGFSLGTGSSISGNVVSNNKDAGIILSGSGSVLTSNTISGNSLGIRDLSYGKNLVSANTLTGNKDGISLPCCSSNNVISKNMISGNTGIGLSDYGQYNTVNDNTFSNNYQGISTGGPYGSSAGSFYNNNMISNQIQVTGASGSPFSLNPPTGGNYWGDYSTSLQGCTNANNDSFCDKPYPFSGGTVGVIDNYPWTVQNGWHNVNQLDTVPPVVTPPPNQQVTTTSSQGAVVNYQNATATDNVGVISGPICTPASGSTFPIGTTIVTCTASDAAGNVGKATFIVTVQQSQTTTITSSTDKSSYSIGDSIVVSGTVNPVNSVNPQLPVTIQTYDMYNVLVRIDQVIPSPSGQFSATIPAHGSAWQNTGTYTLKIQYDQPTSASKLTFYFNSAVLTQPVPTNSSITVTTDKSTYNDGDMITISGSTTLECIISDTPIWVTITDPIGNTVIESNVKLGSDKTFSKSVTPTGPRWQTAGTYQILVQYCDTDNTVKTHIQFTGFANKHHVTATIWLQGGYPSAIAVNPTTNKIYVNSGNSISVIDGTTNKVTDTISSYIYDQPSAIAVNPITNTIYVANILRIQSDPERSTSHWSDVTVIDGATNKITARIPLEWSEPYSIAVNPTTNKIYVPDLDGVTVIDGATNNVTKIFFSYHSGASKIAVNPITNKIYGDHESDLWVIDGFTNAITDKIIISTYSSVRDVAVNPATNKIYVQLASSQEPSVSVIDGATNTITATIIPVGRALVVNPTTNTVYSTGPGGDTTPHINGTISVSDGTTNKITSTIGGVEPGSFEMAVNPTTNTIYVANYDQSHVTVIDGNMKKSNNTQSQFPTPSSLTSTSLFTPTPQDIQNINQAKANQTIAAEVNVGTNQSTTTIDNNVSVQTTSSTPDSLNVNVSASSQTAPKVIMFNLAATTINVANLKDLGVMYDGKLIQPAPNMDAILHAKPTDNPSFAIVVTQSGVQVLVLVPHFSTHSITITNMSKIMTTTIPEFPFATIILIIATFSIVLIPKVRQFQKL